jgi:hypothetical protein
VFRFCFFLGVITKTVLKQCRVCGIMFLAGATRCWAAIAAYKQTKTTVQVGTRGTGAKPGSNKVFEPKLAADRLYEMHELQQ